MKNGITSTTTQYQCKFLSCSWREKKKFFPHTTPLSVRNEKLPELLQPLTPSSSDISVFLWPPCVSSTCEVRPRLMCLRCNTEPSDWASFSQQVGVRWRVTFHPERKTGLRLLFETKPESPEVKPSKEVLLCQDMMSSCTLLKVPEGGRRFGQYAALIRYLTGLFSVR